MAQTQTTGPAQAGAYSAAVEWRALRGGLAWVLGVQTVLLTVVAVLNPLRLDPDGVAYLEIARHWAHVDGGVMISGYWGPLLSWSMVPVMWVTDDLTAPARVAMALSGIVFTLGGAAVLRSIGLRARSVVLGTALVALAAVGWSVHVTKPDLLFAGLLTLALSRMFDSRWTSDRRVAVQAGVCLGLAYLAKSLGLPAAVTVSVAFALLWTVFGGATRGASVRATGWTLAAAAVVALPWIVTLSVRDGRPTFSSTGPIAHAVAGPRDKARYHPFFTTLHEPEAGRLSGWEDPSAFEYATWSPFESADYMRHQVGLVGKNLRVGIRHLFSFDALGLGLVAVLVALLLHRPWREGMGRDRWRWTVVVLGGVFVLYLPVFAEDRRYYYPAYALLVGVALRVVDSFLGGAPKRRILRIVVTALVTLSFAAPAAYRAAEAMVGIEQQTAEFELARRIRAADVPGPLASANYWRGMYVAFFLRRRWHGTDEEPTPERLLRSRASLVVVRRRSPPAAALQASDRFENLDDVLFGPGEDASASKLMAYRVKGSPR